MTDLDKLFERIEKDIQDTLKNEVAETVKDNLQTAIQEGVYNAYTPKLYKRRKNNGGLLDRRNMESRIDGNTLTVRDNAPLDNGRTNYALDDIIVNGLGYMPFPRDFYSECADRLDETGEHTEALKRGLKKMGYNVK
ncbi:MAG: hypothetical protein E7508_07000 [Ruminococcus sp.]|nr:hypothetical protein [Ruminococcus sp.]